MPYRRKQRIRMEGWMDRKQRIRMDRKQRIRRRMDKEKDGEG